MPDSTDWILKIISGPHQGAEMVVRAGRLVIGSHAECDLVLQDLLVAPQHLAIVLEKNILSAEPLEGPAFLKGKRLRAVSPVPPFEFITLGTTHIVIGPAAARWPLLSIADVPPLEKETEAPAAAANGEKPSAQPAGEANATHDPKNPQLPTPAQRKRAFFLAGFGGVLLLVWVVLWLRFSPTPEPTETVSARERVATILHGFPDASALTVDERDSRLTISGYLANDSTHRELAALLREEAPEATLRLWSSPRILDTARALLSQQNLALDLATAPGGTLRVSGILPPRTDWPRMRQLLLAEVPGLIALEETFLPSPAASHASTANSLRAVPTAAPGNQPGDLTLVALQSLGEGQGWIRLSDGRVYFRSARLPDGAILTSIASDHAFIQKQGATLRLTLGRALAQAGDAPDGNITKSLP